jgi:HK97 family phage major capsid protein
MKLKQIRGEDGQLESMLQDDAGEVIDFLDGERSVMTTAEKRTLLASISEQVNAEADLEFRNFLQLGRDGLSARAQAVGVDAAGGYITPASFADRLTVGLKQHDEIFEAATLVETDRGTAFSFPIDDDSGAVATIVAENAQSLTTAPAVFDNVAFPRCPQWRSGVILAPFELVQDSAFDFSGILANAAARRFARGCGAAFIATLLSESDTGVTTAAAGAATGDEIVDLMAAVDPAYALRGAFLMSPSTLTALRKLKASTAGSYLLDFDRDANGRVTLFDMPVYQSPSMPALGATNKAIAFGDLSRFIRRQVRNSLTLRVYNERWATAGQIGYEAFLRVDGKLAKSAVSPLPIRLLACHA